MNQTRRQVHGWARFFQERGPGSRFRKLESLRFWATRDRQAAIGFLTSASPLTIQERIGILVKFTEITNAVRGYHTQGEMLEVSRAILDRSMQSGLTVVECGVAKGSSTAKLSVVTARAGGELWAFDSFRGIPRNDEVHQNLDGRRVVFHEGAFTGRLGSVQKVLREHGEPSVVRLQKGWLEETLPGLQRALDVVVLDLDLLASTRTALRYLFPRMRKTGVLFTQDGHLKAIVDMLGSASFWRDEIGVDPPELLGLGERKLVSIRPR